MHGLVYKNSIIFLNWEGAMEYNFVQVGNTTLASRHS